MRQRTSIIVSHRISTVRAADLIFLLDQRMAATQQHSQQLVQHVSLAHDHLSEFAPSVTRKSGSFSSHVSSQKSVCQYFSMSVLQHVSKSVEAETEILTNFQNTP